MKRTPCQMLVLFLLTFCVSWTGCGGGSSGGFSSDSFDFDVQNSDFVVTNDFSFEIDVVDHTRLRLTAINSTVTIVGEPNRGSVLISGEKRVGSNTIEDAEQQLLELKVDLQVLTEEIFLRTMQPQQSAGRNYVVNYTIIIPEDLEVFVDSVNGTVTVDAVSSSVDVNLVNGTIELRIPQEISAIFSAHTANGTIDLRNLQLKDEMRFSNSLQGRFGDGENSISLDVANGNINVSGL